MSEHVGHKVEVSGTSLSAAAAEKAEHAHAMGGNKETKAEEKMEKKDEKGEHHLKVAALKHISPTCP